MPDTKAKIGGGGRLVIPAEYRRALGIDEGDEVILRLENEQLRILTTRQAMRHAQRLVRRYSRPGRRLSQELLDERRQEAKRE